MEIERRMKWYGRVPPLDLSSVSVCPRETEQQWKKVNNILNNSRTNNNNHQFHRIFNYDYMEIDNLPRDPRDWTRNDVWEWINLTLSLDLSVTEQKLDEKFPMNGKALCLMKLDMYLSRIPNGGQILYYDFQKRLAKVMNIA